MQQRSLVLFRLRQPLMLLAMVLCLALLVTQVAVAMISFAAVGFTHESWHTPTNTGYHANRGAVLSGRGLRIFIEAEQHPVPPGGHPWFPRESDTLESGGAPPQFTVRHLTTVTESNWLGIGYRYSTRSDADWHGQYHLISVGPLWLIILPGAVVALAGRSLVRSFKQRRRFMTGLCQQCGYDLRAGHLRCPECGTTVSSSERPTVSA